MADELDPVEQQFIADMDEYLADLETGAAEAEAFADANTEAAAAVDDLRDNAAEADAEIVQLVVATNDAADAAGNLRDDATEADGALDTLAASAEAAAEAEGSLRDNAAEADAALDDQQAKALEAAASTEILKGSLDDAHSSSDKLVEDSKDLKNGLDDVKKGADDSKDSIGDLARDGSTAGSLLSSVFGAGGAVSSGFSQLTNLVGKIPLSMLAIVPAVLALTPEVVGLGAGLLSAGAGAAGFALLAAPAFEAVKNAMGDTQKQLDKLSPDEKDAVEGIKSLEAEWKKMSKAFEPDAFKVFNDGLQLANTLLPAVTPFAKTFADALDGLLQKVDKFAASKGFKEWLAEFQKLEGPSITAIGDGIGKVAVAFGKLLTIMPAKDVVHAINIAFDALAIAINAVSYMVTTLMKNWDSLSNATDAVRESIIRAGHDIEAAWNAVVSFIASAAKGVAADAAKAWNDIENATTTAWNAVRNFVTSAVSGIVSTAEKAWDDVKNATTTAWDDVKNFVSSTLSGIASDAESIWNSITSTTTSAWNDVKNAVSTAVSGIVSDAENAWNTVRSDVTTAWDDIKSAVESGVSNVVSYVSGLPGKFMSALASLPGQMLSFGENIINSFLSGIENAAGGLLSEVSSLAGDVSSAFSSVLGILSPSRVFRQHGVDTLQGYIDGVKSMGPAVRSAMSDAGGAVAAGGITGTGSAVANGSSVHVNVPISLGAGTQGYNNPAFLQYIQQTVQEATLRYTQVNPSNGLNLAGKLA